MSSERLQKLLAAAGVASRRHSEELMLAGRVRVDGVVVRELGSRADPAVQRIELDGRQLQFQQVRHYVVLNKPTGYITSAHDPEGRPTVLDLVQTGVRLFPVGRLDWDSEGLLLLTDDGDLTYRLTHPRFGVEKQYLVWTSRPTDDQLRALAQGVLLDDGVTAPTDVWLNTDQHPTNSHTHVSIVLHEGRNRQVRRMFAAVGLPVFRLRRVGFGPLQLGEMPIGAWRHLHAEEVAWLRESVGMQREKEVQRR